MCVVGGMLVQEMTEVGCCRGRVGSGGDRGRECVVESGLVQGVTEVGCVL